MGRAKTVEQAELLAIAQAVLIQHGVPGAAKKIAKRAGISEAAVFQRLGKKRKLLLAALAPPTFEVDEIIAVASTELDPQEALAADAHRLLAYFRRAVPRLLPIMGEPSAERRALLTRLGRNPALKLRAALEVNLHAKSKAARVSQVGAEAAATLLVFGLYSIALLEAIHGQALPNPSVRSLVDVLWLGMRPAKEKKQSPAPLLDIATRPA